MSELYKYLLLIFIFINTSCFETDKFEKIITVRNCCWNWYKVIDNNQKTLDSTNSCFEFSLDGSITQYFIVDTSLVPILGVDEKRDKTSRNWDYNENDSTFIMGTETYRVIKFNDDTIIMKSKSGNLEALIRSI